MLITEFNNCAGKSREHFRKWHTDMAVWMAVYHPSVSCLNSACIHIVLSTNTAQLVHQVDKHMSSEILLYQMCTKSHHSAQYIIGLLKDLCFTTVSHLVIFFLSSPCSSSALTLLVRRQEGHPASVYYWVVGCWCGCLSEARCRLACGPADATATHCPLLQ